MQDRDCDRQLAIAGHVDSLEDQATPSSILIAVAALRFLYKLSLKKHWTFADVIPLEAEPDRP
jgi:hypothetical protein